MTDREARRIIFGALFLSAALTAGRHLKDADMPPLRVAFGAVVAAVLLSILAEVSPRLAATFAAFTALSIALTNGGALDAANNLLNRK